MRVPINAAGHDVFARRIDGDVGTCVAEALVRNRDNYAVLDPDIGLVGVDGGNDSAILDQGAHGVTPSGQELGHVAICFGTTVAVELPRLPSLLDLLEVTRGDDDLVL